MTVIDSYSIQWLVVGVGAREGTVTERAGGSDRGAGTGKGTVMK